MRRAIISTSSSCLDYFQIPDNVFMLRNHIHVLGNNYLEGESITVTELSRIMNSNKDILPKTLPPKEDEIADLFYNLMNKGYTEILVICIAKKLSKTYEHVNNVKALFANKINIYVFDTYQSSFMESLMVKEAAKMSIEGRELYEIERRLKYMRDEIGVWFMLDDLRNMIKTKRISAPAGYFANFFNIKPLLGLGDEGAIIPVDKVRKTENAIARMCELANEKVKGQKNAQIYLMSGGDIDLDKQVKAALYQYGHTDIAVVPVSSASLANLGTKGVGIGIFVDNWKGKKQLSDLAKINAG